MIKQYTFITTFIASLIALLVLTYLIIGTKGGISIKLCQNGIIVVLEGEKLTSPKVDENCSGPQVDSLNSSVGNYDN